MIRLVWLTLLAGHIGAAAVWWWLMPGGFPSSATAFWVNQVIPPLVMALFLLALLARGRISEAILPALLIAVPFFWMAFAISARITFVESFASSWYLPFIGGAGLLPLWRKQFRSAKRPFWVVPLAAIPAALAGWALPGALRAPEPATTPVGAALAAAPPPGGDRKIVKLTRDAQFHPTDGRLVIRRDQVILNVQPLLTFADRSPDRSWTGLAPEGRSWATKRTLVTETHDAAHRTLYYKDEDASVLDVAVREGALEVDARSRLAQPIYSHANSYAELTLQGHKKLSVAFSPVGQQRFEVTAPTAPVRFAYVDGDEIFHVMQAKERQRGPFTELARGRLRRSDPLTLTLFDGDKPAFTVTFADWAAQASTQLSPTAGDGIPVDVVELVRGGEPETAPALISLSLAATTIGRGTQSVGHAAGVYRDRVSVHLPPR